MVHAMTTTCHSQRVAAILAICLLSLIASDIRGASAETTEPATQPPLPASGELNKRDETAADDGISDAVAGIPNPNLLRLDANDDVRQTAEIGGDGDDNDDVVDEINPDYFEQDSADEGRNFDEVADKQKEAAASVPTARVLGMLLSPYNPYNPFAKLLTPASSATSDFTQYLITSKIPQAALAPLSLPQANADPIAIGNILFLQKSSLSPVIAVTAGMTTAANAGLTTTTTGLIEIRTNPVPTTGSNRCSDDNLGALFNPTAASVDGGVITRSATVTGNQFLRSFVVDVQPTRATLYSPSSIIGRSVRYSNGADAPICGTIVAA